MLPDHNPRTPRQMPMELRLGIARRQSALAGRWPWLLPGAAAAAWLTLHALHVF